MLWYYGTEIVGDELASTVQERLGRCYALAGYALALGSAPRDAMLVHGTIHGTSSDVERIGHAWLQLADDTIWEPVTCNFYSFRAWTIFAHPRVDHQYTQDDVLRASAASGHWGPWTHTMDNSANIDE